MARITSSIPPVNFHHLPALPPSILSIFPKTADQALSAITNKLNTASLNWAEELTSSTNVPPVIQNVLKKFISNIKNGVFQSASPMEDRKINGYMTAFTDPIGPQPLKFQSTASAIFQQIGDSFNLIKINVRTLLENYTFTAEGGCVKNQFTPPKQDTLSAMLPRPPVRPPKPPEFAQRPVTSLSQYLPPPESLRNYPKSSTEDYRDFASSTPQSPIRPMSRPGLQANTEHLDSSIYAGTIKHSTNASDNIVLFTNAIEKLTALTSKLWTNAEEDVGSYDSDRLALTLTEAERYAISRQSATRTQYLEAMAPMHFLESTGKTANQINNCFFIAAQNLAMIASKGHPPSSPDSLAIENFRNIASPNEAKVNEMVYAGDSLTRRFVDNLNLGKPPEEQIAITIVQALPGLLLQENIGSSHPDAKKSLIVDFGGHYEALVHKN